MIVSILFIGGQGPVLFVTSGFNVDLVPGKIGWLIGQLCLPLDYKLVDIFS